MALTESYVPVDTSVPLFDSTVASVLREAAADSSGLLALVEGLENPDKRQTWTFAQLLDDAERIARALAHRFDEGERVALWAPNMPEWVLIEYAFGLTGLVLVTVNPAYQPQELKYALEQSRSAGVFYLPGFRGNNLGEHLHAVLPDLVEMREVVSLVNLEEWVAAAPEAVELPDVAPDDPAQLLYTSGTTSFPKGALLHHRGITNNTGYIFDRLALKQDNALVSPMTLYHAGGCVLGVFGTIQNWATLVFLETFELGLMLELIKTHKATHIAGVPTMLIAMMEHPTFATRDLSSLVSVCSGGATVPVELVRSIEESTGAALSIIYG